jgi:hypothetical protein
MITLLHILATAPITTSQVPNLPTPSTNGVIHQVLGITFGIIGAFALLMLTVSGLRYVLSSGDPQKTARAKDGIIYALVGVAIAVTAESIIALVGQKL